MSEGFDYFGLAAGLALLAFPKPELSSVTGILDVDKIESGECGSNPILSNGSALQAGDVSSSLTPAASVAGWANGKPPAVIDGHSSSGRRAPATRGLEVRGATPRVSPSLPMHAALGDTRAEEPSCNASALRVSCHRVSEFTLYERVTAVMADAAFIQSAQFWGKVISKCEDVSLAEGYRLEELDAEREGRFA